MGGKKQNRSSLQPTLQDVASLAGVSTATVSRTLNSPDLVDPETRQIVSDVIKRCGYVRNEAARTLAMRSTRIIGLMTDHFSSSHSGPIMDETFRTLHSQGYYTVVEATGNQLENVDDITSERAFQSLIDRQVEAIILVCTFADEHRLQAAFDTFPQTVVVGWHSREPRNNCITVDQYLGGSIAAKHFIENGHDTFAMITGPEHKVDVQQRSKGFIDTLSANNYGICSEHIHCGNFKLEDGMKAAQSLLQNTPLPTAIFVQNDDMAAGVIKVLIKAGIRVPEDISVIGFDNGFISKAFHPGITSIDQPHKNMGQAAAELALSMVKVQTPDTSTAQAPTQERKIQTHFTPRLIERGTVARCGCR